MTFTKCKIPCYISLINYRNSLNYINMPENPINENVDIAHTFG